MYTVFILLFLLCLVATIVGLIKPNIFSKMFKGNVSRKKITIIFGVAALVFFIIAVATTPKDLSKQADDGKQQGKPQAQTTTDQQAKPSATKTLEERVTDTINGALRPKTNTNKPKVVGVEIEKYDDKMLSLYNYQSNDKIVWLLIKINADENITTNLQKGTMNNEATKIAQAIFPLDPTIGNITIWSQLPIKDQYGNVKDDTAVVYSISRALYSKINWTNFNHNDLPSLLKSEAKIDDRNSYVEQVKL